MTELIVSAPQNQSLLTLPPRQMAQQATEYAEVLADIIEKQKLYTNIQGKKYVKVEGWCTLGTMLGFTARESRVTKLDDGSYEAYVDLVRISDGVVLGGGSALCSIQEKRWANADEYARRSMAITRAVGKAYRINFAWILALAGYEGTPLEEMPEEKKVRDLKSEGKEVIYTGTTDQQRGIKTILTKEKVPEDSWAAINDRMMNQPYTQTTIRRVIADLNN